MIFELSIVASEFPVMETSVTDTPAPKDASVADGPVLYATLNPKSPATVI